MVMSTSARSRGFKTRDLIRRRSIGHTHPRGCILPGKWLVISSCTEAGARTFSVATGAHGPPSESATGSAKMAVKQRRRDGGELETQMGEANRERTARGGPEAQSPPAAFL